MLAKLLKSIQKPSMFYFSTGYVSHRDKPDNNDSTPF